MQRAAGVKTRDCGVGGAPRGSAPASGSRSRGRPTPAPAEPGKHLGLGPECSQQSVHTRRPDRGTPSSPAHRKASEAVDEDGSGSSAPTCPGAQDASSRGEHSVPSAVLATRRLLQVPGMQG